MVKPEPVFDWVTAIRKGVDFLLRTQEQDGSWGGRWGVNYIYGTFLALRGLRAAGYSDREAAMLRAGEWLAAVGLSRAPAPQHALPRVPRDPQADAAGEYAGGRKRDGC